MKYKVSYSPILQTYKEGTLKVELSTKNFQELLENVLDNESFNDVKRNLYSLTQNLTLRSHYSTDSSATSDYRTQKIELPSSLNPEKTYLLKFKFAKYPKCK